MEIKVVSALFNHTFTDPVTSFFAVIILSIFIFSCILVIFEKISAAQQWASLLTPIGIVGTFVGIFEGMQGLEDPSNFTNLINAMKIAFSTSILGLGSNIIFSIFLKFNQKNQLPSENPVFLLGQILKKIEEGNNKLDHFLDNAVKSSTAAIIEALEKVIKDFNAKINDQFGENFKHLNQGVEKLVTWQTQYKEHMDNIQNVLQGAASSLQSSDQSIQSIKNSLQGLDQQIQPINKMIHDLEEEHKALTDNLDAFANLSENAREALPNMKKYIEESTETLLSSAHKTKDSLMSVNKLFEQQSKEIIKETSKLLSELSENQRKRIDEFSEELDKSLGKKLEKALNYIGEFHYRLKKNYPNDNNQKPTTV